MTMVMFEVTFIHELLTGRAQIRFNQPACSSFKYRRFLFLVLKPHAMSFLAAMQNRSGPLLYKLSRNSLA